MLKKTSHSLLQKSESMIIKGSNNRRKPIAANNAMNIIP